MVTTSAYDGLVRTLDIAGSKTGPLKGKTFVAKDLFDIAGVPTACGNPKWEQTHPVPTQTASAVQKLLDAGARLTGKACTDELAFSLDGINKHYGTPLNPRMPEHIPGGSSSGSASLVAASKADFALGTDTSGSIRVPASYCGIFGFRPTAGSIDTDGVTPLAPSFDSISWFSRDSGLLRLCGDILLPSSFRPERLKPVNDATIALAVDAFAVVDQDYTADVDQFAQTITTQFGARNTINLFEGGLLHWMNNFRVVKDWEAWKTHGAWIQSNNPDFAPLIAANFQAASQVTASEYELASAERNRLIAWLDGVLIENDVVLLPTVWSIPPLRTASIEELRANRLKNFNLCCVASLAGIPAVNIPAEASKPNIGLSLIARRGRDIELLNFVEQLTLH